MGGAVENPGQRIHPGEAEVDLEHRPVIQAGIVGAWGEESCRVRT